MTFRLFAISVLAPMLAFCGGKDIYGNDLTKTNLLGYVDGGVTTVGDIADFATTRTDTNNVRSVVDASFVGGTQNVNRVTGSFDALSNRVSVIEGKEAGWDAKAETSITNGLATTTEVRVIASSSSVTNKGAVAAASSMTNALPAWTKTATKPRYTANEVGALPVAGGSYTGEVKVVSASDERQVRIRAMRIDVSVTNESARVKVKNSSSESASSIVADDEHAYLSLSGTSGGLEIDNTGRIATDEGATIQIPTDKNGRLALESVTNGLATTAVTDGLKVMIDGLATNKQDKIADFTSTNAVENLIRTNVADWAMAGRPQPTGLITNVFTNGVSAVTGGVARIAIPSVSGLATTGEVATATAQAIAAASADATAKANAAEANAKAASLPVGTTAADIGALPAYKPDRLGEYWLPSENLCVDSMSRLYFGNSLRYDNYYIARGNRTLPADIYMTSSRHTDPSPIAQLADLPTPTTPAFTDAFAAKATEGRVTSISNTVSSLSSTQATHTVEIAGIKTSYRTLTDTNLYEPVFSANGSGAGGAYRVVGKVASKSATSLNDMVTDARTNAVFDCHSLETNLYAVVRPSVTNEVEKSPLLVTTTNRMKTAEANITGLTTRMGTAESGITGLSTRMTAAEAGVSGLSTRMTAVESSAETLSYTKLNSSGEYSSFAWWDGYSLCIGSGSTEYGSSYTAISPYDVIVYNGYSSYYSLSSLFSNLDYLWSEVNGLSSDVSTIQSTMITGAQVDERISTAMSSTNPGFKTAVNASVDATNPSFSNQVLAVGLGISIHVVEEINELTRRGSFSSNCWIVVDDYFQNNDVVKSVLKERTGRADDLGTGWGYLLYNWTTDMRTWLLYVPQLSVTQSSSTIRGSKSVTLVDSNGVQRAAQMINITQHPLLTDVYSYAASNTCVDVVRTDEKAVIGTTNGSKKVTYDIGTVNMTKGMFFNVRVADVDLAQASSYSVTPSLSVSNLTHTVVVPGTAYMSGLAVPFTMTCNISNITATVSGKTATLSYSLHSRARFVSGFVQGGEQTLEWDSQPTLSLAFSHRTNELVPVAVTKMRMATVNTAHYIWDPTLKRTWEMRIDNGCMYTVVVSEDNLTERE